MPVLKIISSVMEVFGKLLGGKRDSKVRTARRKMRLMKKLNKLVEKGKITEEQMKEILDELEQDDN